MPIQLDSIVRTSSIDPVVDPISVTVGYSSATGPVSLVDIGGSFLFGPYVATGGAFPSGSLSGTSGVTLAPGATAASGFGVWDGTNGDGITLACVPMWPSLTAVTQLSTYDWQFGPTAYDDFHNLMGGGPVPAPFDDWFGQPGGVDTWSLSRVFGGTNIWEMRVPYSSFLWDFGDGNTSTAPNPTHTYGAAGLYPATLTVDYTPYNVPAGFPFKSGPTTITLGASVYIPRAGEGWHVGRVGVGPI